MVETRYYMETMTHNKKIARPNPKRFSLRRKKENLSTWMKNLKKKKWIKKN